MNFSSGEIILTSAARLLKDGDRILLGSGPSNLVFALASRLNAGQSVGYYGNGIIRNDPITPIDRIPGNPSSLRGASQLCSSLDVLGLLQKGKINVSIVAAEKVDSTGNLNPLSSLQKIQTAAGTVSEGNPDAIGLSQSLIIMTPHEETRLVEKLERPATERTIPARDNEAAAVDYLITDLARFERTPEESEWVLTGCLEDVSEEEVQKQTGFSVTKSDSVETVSKPSEEELEILRSFDTEGIWKNL